MKIMFSVILIASLMLLSSCELGTGGRATAIGGVSYLPVYQCAPAFKGVINFIPSTEACPKYDWTDWDQDYVTANCGKVKSVLPGQDILDRPVACTTSKPEESLLGYLKPLQNGQCAAGQVKIIQCLAKHTYTEKTFGQVKRTQFNNDYLSTEQIGCPDGEKQKDIGCAEASQTTNTKPIYLCTPQLHLDFGIGKYRWNYFASTSNYCGGWGAKGIIGYWIQPITPTATAPAAQKPELTACDQLKATNSDLNTKITRLKEENALMEKQLSTIGGK